MPDDAGRGGVDRQRRTATRERCWTPARAKGARGWLRPLLKSSAATVTMPIMRAIATSSPTDAGQPQPTISWREGFGRETAT
jgi:hypothetical protein